MDFRILSRLTLSYLIISFCIYFCLNISMYFYPFAILIIGNQMNAIILIGHEGAHQLLSKNKNVNYFFSSTFCHFPFFISHELYKFIHLQHHRFLGLKKDPDILVYQNQFRSYKHYMILTLIQILSGKIILDFFSYYNGLNIYFFNRKLFPNIKPDYFKLLLFWAIAFSIILKLNIFKFFLIFWIIPLIVFFPWLKLINSFHHFHEGGPQKDFARNFSELNIVIKIFLFPLNSNYHAAHHHDPRVPYYKLPLSPFAQSDNYNFNRVKNKIFHPS